MFRTIISQRHFIVVLILLLSGCATLAPNFEQPTLKLTSLALGQNTGLSQTFKIGLMVTNPNSSALPVKGMSYSLNLNGQKMLTGVSGNIPALQPYTETPVELYATADLFSVGKFIRMLATSTDIMDYELKGKLDLSGIRLPVHILESGQINLTQ